MVVQREAHFVELARQPAGAGGRRRVLRGFRAREVRVRRVESQARERLEQEDLEEAGAAVDQDDGRDDEHEEGVAAGEHGDADKQSEEARAGVAHEHPAGLRVVPEIARDAARERRDEDAPSGALGVVRDEQVARDLLVADDAVEEDGEGEERHERQRAGEAVDAVRAVRGVHREPEDRHGHGDVPPPGHDDGGLPEREPDGDGLEAAEEAGGDERDGGVDEPFLRAAPGVARLVVEVAGEHRGEEADDDRPLLVDEQEPGGRRLEQFGQARDEFAEGLRGVDAGAGEGEHEQQHGKREQHHEEARARRLAGGELAVLDELLAVVEGEDAPEARQEEPDDGAGEHRAEAGEDEVGAHDAEGAPDGGEEFQMEEHGGRSAWGSGV